MSKQPYLLVGAASGTQLVVGSRAKRLAAARGLGTHTELEWGLLVYEFAGRCVKCGIAGVEKDHIVPLYQVGSTDHITNLQPLCAFCNSSKGPDTTNWVQIRRANPFELSSSSALAGLPHQSLSGAVLKLAAEMILRAKYRKSLQINRLIMSLATTQLELSLSPA